MNRCPGQDWRYWTSEDVFDAPCPQCGGLTEFWKTDLRRRCSGCGVVVANPKLDLGCAQWCKYAKECLGMISGVSGGLSSQLIQEMRRVFGEDERRIKHALEVLEWAVELLDAEGGDPLVVRAAAILHDIGILEAERKHGSAAGKFQKLEGPVIARDILEKLHIDPERIEHICRIVGSHHSGRDIDTVEFRVIWDADWMVNLPEVCAGKPSEELRAFIERIFRTGTGRTRARELFLNRV